MKLTSIACLALGFMLAFMGRSFAQDRKQSDDSNKALAKWIEALKDRENPERRTKARRALGPGGLYAQVAVPALIDACKEEDALVRSDVAQALADYGPPVVPILVRALKRPEPAVRAGVAEALGGIAPKAPEAVPALIDAMKDPVADVRATAAWSIYRIGRAAHHAVPALILALQDKHDSVREGAALALSVMGPESKPAVAALASVLKDQNRWVRGYAAQALWRIGPDAKSAVPALTEALRNKKDTYGRWTFAQALGGIGPEAKAAVPALVEALQENDDLLRTWAAQALGEIGSGAKAAVPALIAAARHKDNKGRQIAIWALGQIGPDSKAAVPVLTEALSIRSPLNFRSTVAAALGGIGREAKAAIPTLNAIARDLFADSDARKAAADAVVKINPNAAAELGIEAACLNVRLGKFPAIKLGPRPALTEEKKRRLKALIGKLAQLENPDLGLSAMLSGHAFAPLPERAHAEGGLLLFDHNIKPSDALRSLVRQGPDALAFLVESLGDKTPTKLKVDHKSGNFGFMGFGAELDGNPINPLETRVLSQAWPREDQEDEGFLDSYTVKVGDVCFVAIGQIVGRHYQAVHYVPSATVAINSPVQSSELRRRVRAIWWSKDPVRKLFDSLLTDYATEGIYNGQSLQGWHEGSNLQVEAAMRLLYYFPVETAPVIASRLQSFDVQKPGKRRQEREVRNGVHTDDFIKAVASCQAPAIQKALADIAKRTDDPEIKAALEHRSKNIP